MNTHAKIMATTATIDQLKPGSDHPGGSVNSRKEYAAKDIKTRLESILVFGILRPLTVVTGPDTDAPPFYVADGGLSREAVVLGVKEKKLPADYPVRISLLAVDAAMALASSLEANEQVLPPHPVKVYETFAELGSRGKTPEEIGKLFRMGIKEVRGVLALGALSPKIRKAWVDEAIDADDAKAFTLAADHKQQDAVFDKLKRSGELYDHSIRHAIIGDTRDTQRYLTYVGREAYEAAGGKLQEDLFSEGKHLVVQDPALLTKLASEKHEADKQALKAAGWGEVEDSDDLPSNHWYDWKAVPGGAKATPANKAKAVCAVQLNRDGKLEVKYLLRPETKKTGPAKAAKANAKVKAPTTLSNSLSFDLGVMAAHATKDALLADKLPTQVCKVLAGIVSAQITPARFNYMPDPIRKQLAAIRDSITPKVMNEALLKRFDAKRYFPGAPKLLVIRAIREAVNDEQAKKLDKGTKAAAWKFAQANVPKTGWLPPELRTAHYAGPGAAKKKAR